MLILFFPSEGLLNSKNKIVGLKTLKPLVERLRKHGRCVAFTNGCFDLLHLGHTSYLEKAKGRGRVLVVGLNSDASVQRIKGDKRPIVGQMERARVLASLACVDYITIFNDDTPLKVIAALKPDVLVKGADWKGREVVGAELVKANGGKIEFIHYLKGFSTTHLIKRIQNVCAS